MDKKNIKTTDWLTRGISKEQLEREKQEAIMSADLEECHGEVYPDDVLGMDYFDEISEKMVAKGYRKQSKGEWVRQNKIKGKVTPEAVCSECGREVVYQVIDNKYFFENFCPHCGARMKGGE